MLLLRMGDKQRALTPQGWLPGHGGDAGRVALRAEPGFAAPHLYSLPVWSVSNPKTAEQEAAALGRAVKASAELNPTPSLDFHPCSKAGGNRGGLGALPTPVHPFCLTLLMLPKRLEGPLWIWRMLQHPPPPPSSPLIFATRELRLCNSRAPGDTAELTRKQVTLPGGDSVMGDISKKLLPTIAGTSRIQIWVSREMLRAKHAGPGWAWEGNGRVVICSCKVYVPLRSNKIDPWL